jgi:hypothetical protein
MTSIATAYNPYAQLGSAYTRTAAAAQPTLLDAMNQAASDNPFDPNAATNLTLSDAAKAQLASSAGTPHFATVTAKARDTLDQLYKAANVKGPVADDGTVTVNLSSLDRRSLFAIATNSGNNFTPDEQSVASGEMNDRFNAAIAPAAAATSMTNNYSVIYKAAADYLDGASSEEKATATWSAQRAAVLKGLQATQQNPNVAPSGIANDPVAAYLSQYPDGTAPTTSTESFSDVATGARATLDAQAAAAAANNKELVFDPGRKTGQRADLSSIDNRSLSAIALNQDSLFSNQEIFAAKTELDSRTRASILGSLKQSQTSGDPTQLSLGILQSYSAMSPEERQATNWTPAFKDNALQSYNSTSKLLSMLQGMT